MKKISKILMSIVLFVLALPIFTIPASGSEFNFAVESIIPDNQINPQVTWFNLLVEPGDQQTLEVNLRNDTNEEVIVEVEIAAATTNLNGVVEYGVRDVERDSTLTHDLADLVTVPDIIVIPANGSIVLEMELTVPNEDFEGVIAGGITFREQESDDVEEEDEVGMMIRNRFAYVIAMTLQTDEELETLPNFVVNDARADHLNARNVVFVNVQNTEPTFVTWVSLNGRVYRRGETVWHWNEVTAPREMMFAPNSNMDFPIRLDGQAVEAGDYTACVTVTAEGLEEEMVWEDCTDFTITAQEADELNRGDVEIPQLDNTWLIIVLIALVVIILLLLIIILIVKKRKNDEYEEYEDEEDYDYEDID